MVAAYDPRAADIAARGGPAAPFKPPPIDPRAADMARMQQSGGGLLGAPQQRPIQQPMNGYGPGGQQDMASRYGYGAHMQQPMSGAPIQQVLQQQRTPGGGYAGGGTGVATTRAPQQWQQPRQMQMPFNLGMGGGYGQPQQVQRRPMLSGQNGPGGGGGSGTPGHGTAAARQQPMGGGYGLPPGYGGGFGGMAQMRQAPAWAQNSQTATYRPQNGSMFGGGGMGDPSLYMRSMGGAPAMMPGASQASNPIEDQRAATWARMYGRG